MPLSKKQTKRLTQLRAAQSLLQRAHDHIELAGFDIGTYGSGAGSLRPACYIGTVRAMAGLSDHAYGMPADHGDGPELTIALAQLDKLARPLTDPVRLADIKDEYGEDSVGRIVEGYGFTLDSEGMNVDDQCNAALTMFRRALTEVYRKIEKLEAKSV